MAYDDGVLRRLGGSAGAWLRFVGLAFAFGYGYADLLGDITKLQEDNARVERTVIMRLEAMDRRLEVIVGATTDLPLLKARIAQLERLMESRTPLVNEFIELRGTIRRNEQAIERLERRLNLRPSFRGAQDEPAAN